MTPTDPTSNTGMDPPPKVFDDTRGFPYKDT